MANVALKRVREIGDDLIELSHALHASPELGFEEHQSVRIIGDFLGRHSADATVGCYGLTTALEARAGHGRTHVVICAEYDALPAIGHACGHNIIAAAAVGAFIGLRDIADTANLTVRLLGTPGEEVGNYAGKVRLLDAGAFDDVTAAMMVHPAPIDVLQPVMIAAATFDIEYRGKESHAAFYPELGINAVDAMTVAQVAVGLLRQHIDSSDRIHGIITHGGDAVNIVPAFSSGRFMVRATTAEELASLGRRVTDCFRAGALASGASVAINGGDKPYANVVHNQPLSALYRMNSERLGRRYDAQSEAEARRPSGSTDMGNVSQAVPSIHPFLGIDSWPAVNHQPEFAAHCIGASADRAIIDGAVAMAWTALDLASMRNPDSFLAGQGDSN